MTSGVRDFSEGSNCRCDGNSKNARIRHGAEEVYELLESLDKTSTDKDLLLWMSEEVVSFFLSFSSFFFFFFRNDGISDNSI